MKRQEEAERARKLEALESQIDFFNLEIQATHKREKRDALKTQLLSLKDQIQYIKDEETNEHKFWGYVMDNAGDDPVHGDFAYGREVHKDGAYDKQLKTPYGEFPLFSLAGGSGTQRTTT